ncbi:MAG: hypothetical protein BMS9Abin20_0729 [Acidimicrobiia bacterium]|nr:MAG: hypothetical protein BMS9Abin20_0729 [Acidimicrobiia bacterium]
MNMADDDMTSGSDGFDDWLGDEPGPPTDPYAGSAEDDEDDETAEIVVGGDDQDDDTLEVEVPPGDVVDEDTEEVEVPSADVVDDDTLEVEVPSADVVDDETEEVEVPSADVVDDETEEVEVPSGDVVDEDAEEVEVVATAEESEQVDVGEQPDTDEMPVTEDDGDDRDDTGEIEVISIAPYGGFAEEADISESGFAKAWGPGEAGEMEIAAAPVASSPDLFDVSEEDYLAGATREHSDLAEAMAMAAEEDTEQVAIAASLPGLADSVVGFEDVVEAEGLGKTRARASGDLIARVITAVVLILAFAASLVWQPALVAFAIAVFVIGAGEFYTSLVRSDRKPIALFGFIGIIGASLGAFVWGAIAIPVAFFIAVTLLLLFYAVVPGKIDPMGNLALTITVMVWVGLGSFAMLIADSDSYRPLVIGVVVIVAAMDIAQYFIGRALGRTPLAPRVSPKKTVEGLVAGVVVAFALGAALYFVEPFELTSGLVLGAVVAVLAPLGDLAMSAAKRSLGLKDIGSVLPGHGGFLDRIDGLLFVIPAAWVAFLWAGIL